TIFSRDWISYVCSSDLDALVIGQGAAYHHSRVDGVFFDIVHQQNDAAVIQKQFVSRLAVLNQAWVVDADNVLISVVRRVRIRQGARKSVVWEGAEHRGV